MTNLVVDPCSGTPFLKKLDKLPDIKDGYTRNRIFQSKSNSIPPRILNEASPIISPRVFNNSNLEIKKNYFQLEKRQPGLITNLDANFSYEPSVKVKLVENDLRAENIQRLNEGKRTVRSPTTVTD